MAIPEMYAQYGRQMRHAKLDAMKSVQTRWKRYQKAVKKSPIRSLNKEKWYDITYPTVPKGQKYSTLKYYSARTQRVGKKYGKGGK